MPNYIDKKEVRHGKWAKEGNGYAYYYKCTECGWKDGYPFNDRFSYCPNCGARMDGELE